MGKVQRNDLRRILSLPRTPHWVTRNDGEDDHAERYKSRPKEEEVEAFAHSSPRHLEYRMNEVIV